MQQLGTYGISAVKSHVDIISTDFVGFIVQRLCNVANEVHQEAKSVVYFLIA